MSARRGSGHSPAPRATQLLVEPTSEERRLLIDAIAALHAGGAGTERSLERAAQLETRWGGSSLIDLGWNQSTIVRDTSGQQSLTVFAATPSAVSMNRVLAVDTAIDRFTTGSTTVAQAQSEVRVAAALPSSNIFLFAAACAVGASALAIIFGIGHWQTLLLIAVVSALGAFLRRGIGKLGGNNYWQVGLAALLAGLFGAVATNLDISSSLRLAALCPCMILVPGPHLLNSAFDLAALRIPLGLARLTFASLTLLSIGAGLLAGLTIGGAELVVDPAGREIPLWLDAVSAGIVAVCYGIFYSAPLRILIWPLVVGAAVHALRWISLEVWSFPGHISAGLACLAAGFILLPVSRRLQLPFSAIGFASVVSLIPGAVILRALAGLAELQSASGQDAQKVLVATVNDANTAWLTIFAMAIGFLVPAGIYTWLRGRRTQAHTLGGTP